MCVCVLYKHVHTHPNNRIPRIQFQGKNSKYWGEGA